MKFILFYFLGIVFWTFLEYNIHRFLGHKRKGNNMVKSEHLRHHREGDYFAPMIKKFVLAVVVISLARFITALLFDGYGAFAFAFGLTTMYIVYEIAHRVYHVKDPFLKRYGLKMRKHHFYHHFKNPKVNHGVTVAFWDRVFGTYSSTKEMAIPVPKRLAMEWLLDQDSEVKNGYEKHFNLR